MSNFGNWVMGFCCAVMAVAGLFVAARGGVGVPYWGGLAFSAFAVAFVFLLIKTSFDHKSHES